MALVLLLLQLLMAVPLQGARVQTVRVGEDEAERAAHSGDDEGEDARLQEQHERHEGHAHEHHGHCEAPVRGGDGEFGDAEYGLPMFKGSLALFLFVARPECERGY